VNIIDKIVRASFCTWEWLSGKKRRIAILSSAVMQLTKEHTLTHQIASVCFWLFGGADVAQNGSKILKDKLPLGIKK